MMAPSPQAPWPAGLSHQPSGTLSGGCGELAEIGLRSGRGGGVPRQNAGRLGSIQGTFRDSLHGTPPTNLRVAGNARLWVTFWSTDLLLTVD